MPTTSLYTKQLFQSRPKLGDKKKHGFKWTTWFGSIAAGRRLAGQLLANEKLIGTPYPYQGTIKFLVELTVPEIKIACGRISRKLKANGIVAFRIVEISRKNKIDYHLVFRQCPAELMEHKGKKLKAVIRSVCGHKLNMQFEAIKCTREWVNYIVKSKIGGTRQGKAGDSDDVDAVAQADDTTTRTDDIYAGKRVLFIEKSGLAKHGDIGDFWAASRAKLTEQYKAEKAKTDKVRNVIDTAAKQLAELTQLHPVFVEKKLIKEWEANPNDSELRKQNSQLADDWLYSQPEAEDMRDEQQRFDAKRNDFAHLLGA